MLRLRVNPVAAVWLCGALATPIAAAPRQHEPDPATLFYATDFESGEGFTVGWLEGQSGWTVSGGYPVYASISASSPFAGSQCLHLEGFGGGGLYAFSPVAAVDANTASTTSMQMRIESTGTGLEIWGLTSEGTTSWQVLISEFGTMWVLAPGGGYSNAGTRWTPGVYKELRVDFDPGNGTIHYFCDGVLVFTGATLLGDAVEQIVVGDGSHGGQGYVSWDIDHLSIRGLGELVGVEATTWSQIKSMMR